MGDVQFGVRDGVEIRCACGGAVSAGFCDAPGHEEDGAPIVIHAVPTCSDFDRRDTFEFLQWLNGLNAS